MSIDTYLYINTGKQESLVAEIGNITSNLQPMWRKALLETMDLDMDLCDFDGWKAETAVEVLQKMLVHMLMNKAEYEKLNPSNGWGKFDDAVQYITSIVTACYEHPACTIRTSC